MPTSRPRKRKSSGEIIPPLSKLDKIDALLKVQLETFPQKELSPEEVSRWHEDLGPYSVEAIEWAFDNWRRNGHFFPVPGDILEQCDTFTPAIAQGTCSAECRSRHGKGLGEADILWLWKRFSRERSELGRPLSDLEQQRLLLLLDKKRGGPPEYRKQMEVPF